MATTTATANTSYKKMDFERIQYEGFSYSLSPEVLKIIQGIADQVGSPEYVKTPQFEKRSIPINASASTLVTNHRQNNNEYNNKRYDTTTNSNSSHHNNKKRDKYNYNNKGQEITDDDWEAIR